MFFSLFYLLSFMIYIYKGRLLPFIHIIYFEIDLFFNFNGLLNYIPQLLFFKNVSFVCRKIPIG